MATQTDHRHVPRLSITLPSPSRISLVTQLLSQSRPLTNPSQLALAGGNGPCNSANFRNMVIASDLNFQNGVSGANNARPQTSFVPAPSFELRPPFRPARAAESTAYLALPTNTSTEPPARKRKHVEMTRELESAPFSGQKRTRLSYDPDTQRDDPGTVSPTDETVIPTPTSTSPEARLALPDLEPLGPVTLLDIAKTIQRALDALDQPDAFKQSLSDSPTGPRRHSTDASIFDQGPAEEGSSPAINLETGPPTRPTHSIPSSVLEAFKAHRPLLERRWYSMSVRGVFHALAPKLACRRTETSRVRVNFLSAKQRDDVRCGLGYESWDLRLLASLPPMLRAEFPAVERNGQLVALPHVFGDNPANTYFASLEPSQPPQKDSPSLTQAPSSYQACLPSVTLQRENSSPETSVASSSTSNPESPSSPNTSITEGTLSSERTTAPVIEDLSSSAPTSNSLVQTQTQKPFPSRNTSTSRSTNSPNPVNLQKGRAKASTASDKETRRKRRSTVHTTTTPQFLILVPPLTVRKNTLMSNPTVTQPSTFSYSTLDCPKLPLSPAVPPAAVEAPQQPVNGPSTSTSTEPASLTKASQVEEDAPAKPKKPRTLRRCSKCGVKGCKGGNQVKLCTNPCVGCGQASCDKPHTSKKQNLCVALLVGLPEGKGGREE
ncbi:hypothetical protein M407DRAFT_222279 [Tulasnella calospora MUT 4182]|uniref:Uncharacterized protein n=1 Tax=Tulasnella calospora MUT 4182 TaxID=1051891 RepID=A0A0C3Q730_9AGAM|nr:hypothetical protein M407DRAFT_222279 [Tulasnella calospora MUT 4182]